MKKELEQVMTRAVVKALDTNDPSAFQIYTAVFKDLLQEYRLAGYLKPERQSSISSLLKSDEPQGGKFD